MTSTRSSFRHQSSNFTGCRRRRHRYNYLRVDRRLTPFDVGLPGPAKGRTHVHLLLLMVLLLLLLTGQRGQVGVRQVVL